MTNSIQFIDFFRQASPYIHQHRNKTFVFCIQDDETTKGILKSLLHDIAILHSLRVKVIIVFGARYSLNNRLENQNFHDNCRITDIKTMRDIQEIIGALQIQVESILSMGLANSPMQGAGVCTSSGNFIIAKPVGVRDGVDFGFTGEIRKVRSCAINERLNDDTIVIIPPLGYSATGEVFNLTTESVASQVAASVNADKLLFFNNEVQSLFDRANSSRVITPDEAADFVNDENISTTLQTVMGASVQACIDGVKRIHLVSTETDGAVLAELFTRDGVGLMITNDAYDRIEQATIDDIPGLLQLIRPLEKKGVLIRRSRELLEVEIEYFSLLKRDNTVIGCTALYPYLDEGMAELGCLAVNPEYRRNGLADMLLQHLEDKARTQGVKTLFCLTTQTSHWFVERGFVETDLSSLPQSKQEFYNFGRSSKPYIKILS